MTTRIDTEGNRRIIMQDDGTVHVRGITLMSDDGDNLVPAGDAQDGDAAFGWDDDL